MISLDKRPGKDLARLRRACGACCGGCGPTIVHTRNLGTVDMQWVAAAAGVRAPRARRARLGGVRSAGARTRSSLRIRRACRPVIQRYVPMSRDIARWLEREVGVEPRPDPAAVQRRGHRAIHARGVDRGRRTCRGEGSGVSSSSAPSAASTRSRTRPPCCEAFASILIDTRARRASAAHDRRRRPAARASLEAQAARWASPDTVWLRRRPQRHARR